MEIKTPKLLKIMHEELGARYKRIKKVSFQGNSDKNLLMRQQFVHAFMKIDLKKKTIINVDETWLGMTDFRRMRWEIPGLPNSVAKKQLTPRISMIAALDTSGGVYMTLMQSNSNSQTMELFYTHLVRMLDDKDKYWRRNTIIMCDGASYHTSEAMRDLYQKH